MLSKLIVPITDIVITTASSIAFDGVVKQLVPSDLKALPAFGIKIGSAVVGGLIAHKIARSIVTNLESVIDTYHTYESEDVPSDQEDN